MASSPSHRSTHSVSPNNLHLGSTPAPKQQRRMTSPASLNLPEGNGRQQASRPPSPLRNGFVPDTSTGITLDDSDSVGDDSDEEEDDDRWRYRPHSPASSVSQLASSFAQRVGSLVGNIGPRSAGHLTDAELEAEAERERDRSRREAEMILTREAQERKLVEERVLAMMESTRALPPPPSRSQSASNASSPSGSQKEGRSWWSNAKNKLTPTKDKEVLTPAQQVIIEAKSREKDKKKGKEKEKEKDWPANTQAKLTDPAFLNLNIPAAPPQRRPVPTSPSSPTPSRPNLSNLPPNLTPSPMRSAEAISPSKEAPPLYAQFNTQGILDVPGTLITIAKRFEKLEKWTVGHVRALEERMSDVERWLVDKEKEKEEKTPHNESTAPSNISEELEGMREHVSELQGRVGELGREMAKLATSSSNLSSGPAREPAPVSVAPQTTSSIAIHSGPSPQAIAVGLSTPHHNRLTSSTARESTSPPMASSKPRSSTGTRLPYPTGDYATPPNSGLLSQGTFSPGNSPPSSINSATRSRPVSVAGAGLPLGTGAGLGISTPSSTSLAASYFSDSSTTSNIPRATSPQSTSSRAVSPAQGLPTPKADAARRSVSPTPRKRYTVALGGPIVAPPDYPSESRRVGTPISFSRPHSSIGTAFFSSSSGGTEETDEKPASPRNGDHEDEDDGFNEETIGKASLKKFTGTINTNVNGDHSPSNRTRAQSVYGFSSMQPPQTPVTPLKPRFRSRSTDRLGPNEGTASGNVGGAGAGVSGTGKFVDPLVLRKQDKEGTKIAMPKPKVSGKVPIGQLVAFFDGEKRG